MAELQRCLHDVNNGAHERMLDVREKNTRTKDNNDYVYRAKDNEFIHLQKKAILALFDKSRKERPKVTYERYGSR